MYAQFSHGNSRVEFHVLWLELLWLFVTWPSPSSRTLRLSEFEASGITVECGLVTRPLKDLVSQVVCPVMDVLVS